MPRSFVVFVAVSIAFATANGSAQTRSATFGPAASNLVTTNPTFLSSLERIAQGSVLFRRAIEALRNSASRIVVLTPDAFSQTDMVSDAAAPDVLDRGLLAETTPLVDKDSRVRAVVVVVNLRLLEQVHARRRSLLGELQSDLDRILVHEVYGHAVPYAIAGDLSGRCPDPAPGERAADACSIRRENDVRSELGLGKRTDAGLEGLTLSRRLQ